MQKKQSEWNWQWTNLYDSNKWLFTEWIYPNTLEDFRGKDVLDCGCGGGQHLDFVAPYANSVTGVDLNCADIACKNNAHNKNVQVVEGDIAQVCPGKKFDIVYSIGVLHHTDQPSVSFSNLKKLVKPGGRVIVWVYSHEGNSLNRNVLEPLKKYVFLALPKNVLMGLSYVTTFLMYLPIYTVYFLPLKFLPFYEYFQNWRKLSFSRNNLNVFDKLNAPQTFFLRGSTVRKWFDEREFDDVHVSAYKGVSWRASGTLK